MFTFNSVWETLEDWKVVSVWWCFCYKIEKLCACSTCNTDTFPKPQQNRAKCQNVGRRRHDRCRKTVFLCLLVLSPHLQTVSLYLKNHQINTKKNSIRTRHFSHVTVYIIPQKDSIVYVCLHAHALQITLHCSPASLRMFLSAHVQYSFEAFVQFVCFSLCIG